jgi:hypothetical protein
MKSKPAFTSQQIGAMKQSLRDILGTDGNPTHDPLTEARMCRSLATTQPFTVQHSKETVAFVKSYIKDNYGFLDEIQGQNGTVGYRWIRGRVPIRINRVTARGA